MGIRVCSMSSPFLVCKELCFLQGVLTEEAKGQGVIDLCFSSLFLACFVVF